MTTTIRDVASRAGVSTATVSRVLSGAARGRPATARRVLAAARDLEYRPSGIARSLKRHRTHTLGLIITDIQNPFYPELVRAVEDAARAVDHSVLLVNGAEDPERERRALEELADRWVDGIIIAASQLTARHTDWLANASIPIALVNSRLPGEAIPAILSDNRAGGRLAAEHLLGLGHSRIGYLTAPVENAAVAERLAGTREALLAAGLDAERMPIEEGDGHVSGGQAAMTRLLRRAPGLTAVVCYNDLTAIGAMRALRAAGRQVPEDVSVVGFDGIDLAGYVEPPLTTVAQQTTEMGRWAVESLLARLDSSAAPRSRAVVLPVALRPGGSTAPAVAAR
jgi:DNA-binding LacI/PurR family transcriptional regulator